MPSTRSSRPAFDNACKADKVCWMTNPPILWISADFSAIGMKSDGGTKRPD